LALADAAEAGSDLAARAAATQTLGEGVVEEAEAPAMAAPAEDQAAAAPEPIRVRSDFNPLATFAPQVRTDAAGKAQVEIKLPDNLTRYRIMVVAVDDDGDQFGSAEANLTARLPLMVRPSAPRFLNFGDKFELPVVLQNQTDEPDRSCLRRLRRCSHHRAARLHPCHHGGIRHLWYRR
jgi:uncharacterized protein YfaS (alpha-2-macroglobulin family)